MHATRRKTNSPPCATLHTFLNRVHAVLSVLPAPANLPQVQQGQFPGIAACKHCINNCAHITMHDIHTARPVDNMEAVIMQRVKLDGDSLLQLHYFVPL
jgi:hypothetical protein